LVNCNAMFFEYGKLKIPFFNKYEVVLADTLWF
jgi:hypothetical protein